MTNDTHDDGIRPLPVENYPDPVLSYALEDDQPIVRAVNEAFRSVFGTDVAFSVFFDRTRFAAGYSATEFTERVRRGEQFSAVLDHAETDEVETSHLLRVVPASAGDGGHIVFHDTDRGQRAAMPDGDNWKRVASVIAHDLRNPLDVAKARLRAGRETDDDTHFEHVKRAHDRMERIIRDVLTASHSEDVITVDPSEAVDLENIAVSAWETVETRGATVTVEESLPTTVADPDHVGRLFENLFRNAVEHGDSQTVRVGGLRSSSATGFYVADDGSGIPPDERQLVFKLGYSSREQGTGLGLAIVARIVAAHDWTIRITESDTGGARFEIRGVGGNDQHAPA